MGWGGPLSPSLMGGGSRCLPLGLAASPPRKLPVLSDSSLDGGVQAEYHCTVLGASTMDPSRALPLFLLLGKTPSPQPLPHRSLHQQPPNTPSSPLQPPEEGSPPSEPLLEFSEPISPLTQEALPRARERMSPPPTPPAGNFRINL